MSGLDRQSGIRDASAPTASRSSFYLAMRILPHKQRDAMYEVYAFCRAVDDIADGSGSKSVRIGKLDRWRADIGRLFAGGGTTELTNGLATAVEAFGLKQEDFLAVIDGMEMDVTRDIRAPSWEEFDLYCDRVASAVGRLSARIFGLRDDKGRQLSHHLGRALQMTNILRDLDEDAEMGRLYVPKAALEAAGITDEDIGKVLADPRLNDACAQVSARARLHFEQASAVMESCARTSVRSPRIMASVYRALLDKLVKRGWTAPRGQVRPSKLQILSALMRYGVI